MNNAWFEVRNSGPLNGEVTIPGAKNSALALVAAGCLTDETITIHDIPAIRDILLIKEIAEDIGLYMEEKEKNTYELTGRHITSGKLDVAKTSDFRASYYFVGALLAKVKTVQIGYPGGDDFGSRPIDQHVKALSALGATFDFKQKYYEVSCDKLTGADITFDVITSGATINAMLAAVKAEGRTVLHNAAKDPEVVDLGNLLNLMGAKIKGAGTDRITIDGVASLHGGIEHTVIPDRLIAGAFLMAAGVTNGRITVKNVIPEHLASCTNKLIELGMTITEEDDSMTASGSALHGARIQTGMYPELATDLQQPLTTLLVLAAGSSSITDKVYPNRTGHVAELKKLGADINVVDHQIMINGVSKLMGATVKAHDVRAGTSLILAGLAADGVTKITDIKHIQRGYEDIVGLFTQLGADITLHQPAHQTQH
ncbi:UDP-N-acetylglucosamine 1-carboxyvinyltransferase [Terribacillus aidingensis]|uniref:UDP-N-acetylglucosamine 1-carboxyvinyltransferase n=1 Tax=Terribacillus aidingensis TaxID=586416 RepID=A0A285NYQ1_9BACI|nr:UDP-N-acetylglucosamine 1-carboxyvinyltransferase [Terribacillus aidingensis]SNZ14579.1 UDP-N-acetylglucosamine 1-carboxyvinyltransferase [Terribacillus aidingensis]